MALMLSTDWSTTSLGNGEDQADATVDYESNLRNEKTFGRLKDEGAKKTTISAGLNETKLVIPFSALGPAEKLDKIKVVQVKAKAHFAKTTLVSEIELAWHGLTDFCFIEENQGRRMKIVVQSNSGFVAGKAIPKDQLTLWQNEFYSYALSNLTPLKDRRFQLKKLEDATIGGKPCLVVEASLPDRPTIKLFFDKGTDLLVKSSFTAFRGEKMLFENQYSDYQETDGVKHWRKLVQLRDGQEFGRLEVESVQFFQQFNKDLFAP